MSAVEGESLGEVPIFIKTCLDSYIASKLKSGAVQVGQPGAVSLSTLLSRYVPDIDGKFDATICVVLKLKLNVIPALHLFKHSTLYPYRYHVDFQIKFFGHSLRESTRRTPVK